MGTLRRRGKIWHVRYSRGGRQFEESSGSERKADAQRLLKLKEGDIAKGIPVTPQMNRVTFEDAATMLVNDYTFNGRKSLAHAQRRIDKHLKHFAGWRLSAITTADVEAFKAKRLTEGASNGEINRELALLKRMFTLAVRGGRLLARPHIPMLQERNVRTGFFEREQFEAVRAQLPAPLRPVVTFAYLTGWRVPSEVLTLQWRQVDFKAEIVTLDAGSTKNGEGRRFPFAGLDELRDLLIDQRRDTDAVQKANGTIVASVFHRHGKPIRSFYKAWDTACRKAGCPGRIPHDFRRTAVRNLVRVGVPEAVSMKLTGHKTRSVFERYNVTSEADLHEATRKLNGAPRAKRGQTADPPVEASA